MSPANNPQTVMFPCDKVTIPTDRQRKDLGDLAPLAESIKERGLINAIVVHADGRLVAGERRFRSVYEINGEPSIRATIFESLSPAKAALIELTENINRKNLTWQEEALAIAEYHEVKTQEHADSLEGASHAGPWTELGTANDVKMSLKHIQRVFKVASAIKAGDQEIIGCTTFSGARNLLAARAERARAAAAVRGIELAGPVTMPSIIKAGASRAENTAAAINAMLNPQPEPEPTDTAALEAALEQHMEEERAEPMVLTGDFLEWADAYAGPKFDVLHVDFPYGKGYSGSRTRRTGRATFAPRYNDSPEIYWQLLAGLLDLQDNICFPVAHCMFWFDHVHYQQTIELFAEAGWKLVAPFPLVWTKSYEGVASDPSFRPRHCYETALLFSRGERRLVNLDKDHFEASSRDPGKLHLNQKPYTMLKFFLNMLVDKNTAVLDPTCGSAMALRAAQDLGSPRVFGVELDKSSAEMARYTMIKPVEELNDA